MTLVRDDLRPVQRRLVGSLIVMGALWLAFLARLWVLQVLQGAKWKEVSDTNRLRRVPIEAPRGTVTDVHGELILDNRPTYQLLLFPEEMQLPQRTESFLIQIGIASAEEVTARVAKARLTSHLPMVIADNLTWSQVTAIAAHRAEYRELEIHPATRRSLPAGPTVAHLVGQLGEVSREQLAASPKFRPGQLVGRSGLERAYQDRLGGSPGNLVVVVDALGRQVSALAEEPAIPGRSLQVTIDLRLQREAAEAMAGQVGAVVALDPRDGALRVLLSQPAFDPDLFAGHLESTKWQELLNDPQNPLSNRALQALYPPGSTIKPIYAAGALRDGVRNPSQSIFCTGVTTIYGHPYRCWQAGGHGRMALLEAIEASCDTYFYHLARDAGIDRLASWTRTFGLGKLTGIELSGESAGLVPDDAWSRRSRGHPWYGGETISVGIGQGPILVTPLQLATAYAALVNGGFLVRPHLDVAQTVARTPLGFPIEALQEVQRGMELVVAGERGTANRLRSGPVAFGGKTGTSQVIHKQEGVHWQDLPWEQRHHALFAGYGPLGDPRLIVVVVVEHGGDAASVAAPIAARILARAFGPEVAESKHAAGRFGAPSSLVGPPAPPRSTAPPGPTPAAIVNDGARVPTPPAQGRQP